MVIMPNCRLAFSRVLVNSMVNCVILYGGNVAHTGVGVRRLGWYVILCGQAETVALHMMGIFYLGAGQERIVIMH